MVVREVKEMEIETGEVSMRGWWSWRRKRRKIECLVCKARIARRKCMNLKRRRFKNFHLKSK